MERQMPLALRTLNERLHFRCIGPRHIRRLEAFEVDLSDWKLSLTHRNPCFWIHTPEQLRTAPTELAEQVRDAVREAEWRNETILVCVDGPAEDVRRRLSASLTQFIVLDQRQQKEIHSSDSPTRVMLDLMLAQMSRSQLAPYETSHSVTGSRFFGREQDLKTILRHKRDTNFIIIGIRRIGKSSLLREIEFQLNRDDPPQDAQIRRVYIDCSLIKSEEDLYSEILNKLSRTDLKELLGRRGRADRFKAQMFEYLADVHGGPITYLLDEIDPVLENDAGHNLFDVLRKASNEHVARFIMAGFRHTRAALSNPNSPLFHFGEVRTLTALERSEVKKMVEGPMDQLRVRLQGRDDLVNRIYRETAGLPNLVQFYCQSLLKRVDELGSAAISPDSLRDVYENNDFRDFVLETFVTNSLPLERALVFALIGTKGLAPDASFTQVEMDAELTQRGLPLPHPELDKACRNLVSAGILDPLGRQYSFRIPVFARMLEEQYPIEFVFEKARQEYFAQQMPLRAVHA